MARNKTKKARTKAPSKNLNRTPKPVAKPERVSMGNMEAQTSKKAKTTWEIGADGVNPCYVASIPPEVLDMVIKLLVTNFAPTQSKRGLKIDRTVHAAFTYPPVDKVAHRTLRSVCRTWAKTIDATHREVHFDGDRSPAPMFACDEDMAKEEIRVSALVDESPDEIIAGEVRRTRLDLERIPAGMPVSLTLIKPRYDADPDPKSSTREGAGFIRPGVTDMVNSVHKGDIASLTIYDDCDTAWVQRLLDEEEEVPDQGWLDRDLAQAVAIMTNFHDVYEKMHARQPPKLGPYQTRRQTALAKKDEEKVWKKLHTLRLMFDGRAPPNRFFIKLSPLNFPALRRVELHLREGQPMQPWVLPYSQITHLTLEYEGASNFILLAMLKLARLSLESLTIRLLSGGYSYERQEPCIDFPKLQILRVYTRTAHKHLEQFFDALMCKNLRTFDITTETGGKGALTPAARFIKRSKCTLRELYIDTLDHSLRSDNAGLETLIRDHSDALEVFHLHGGLFEKLDWLDHLTAPRLRELDFICFGINEWVIGRPELFKDFPKNPDAADFALHLLCWVKEWISGGALPVDTTQHFQSRQSQLAVRFCAAAGDSLGYRPFYDVHEDPGCLMAVSPPQAVEAIQDGLVGEGMKVDIEWWLHNGNVSAYNASRLSGKEKIKATKQ
ncbi:hypothetical protein DFP72DRAFT_1075818 [Ephemerocybe angulata]|uniref:Uncharacterized protein n=1 Tax=Ephemerocybe angulata TaxID=980116 RepID=A0A8H6HJL2_9AGAR|nr:hypothetical protein DFP72DRAFT_1075818 [Tulosesus angulatus]